MGVIYKSDTIASCGAGTDEARRAGAKRGEREQSMGATTAEWFDG